MWDLFSLLLFLTVSIKYDWHNDSISFVSSYQLLSCTKATIREIRQSTLVSWNPSENFQQHSVIGWTVEERTTEDMQNGAHDSHDYRVTVGWGDAKKPKTQIDTAVEDNLSCPIRLPFRTKNQQDALGSTVWPAALAGAILSHSPTFQQMLVVHDGVNMTTTKRNIIELGCGLGLKGLAFIEASCRMAKQLLSPSYFRLYLTDNDESILDSLKAIAGDDFMTEYLDWRDVDNDFVSLLHKHDYVTPTQNGKMCTSTPNIVIGADVAYYHFLKSPLLETIAKMKPAFVFITGQANRQCQWDLFKSFQEDWYNPVTDAHDDHFSTNGNTRMYLYRLHLGSWETTNITETANISTDRISSNIWEDKTKNVSQISTTTTDNSGGTIPIAALVYRKNTPRQLDDDFPVQFFSGPEQWDHIATKRDKHDLYID